MKLLTTLNETLAMVKPPRDRDAINRLEQKISGVGGIILEHFLKKTGIASLSESERGVAFVPAHFPDLTIELMVINRGVENGRLADA